jgi:hypothetical protein
MNEYLELEATRPLLHLGVTRQFNSGSYDPCSCEVASGEQTSGREEGRVTGLVPAALDAG